MQSCSEAFQQISILPSTGTLLNGFEASHSEDVATQTQRYGQESRSSASSSGKARILV